MFYRVFGGNGHGKTSYVLEGLAECVKNEKKAFFIVPEQAALKTEKQIIQALGSRSNLYVEVINFKRLANRVFREKGGLCTTHLDDGAKKMLMMRTLSQIGDRLCEYGKSAESAEFAERAIDMVNELHTYKVTPKELEKAAESLEKQPGMVEISSKLYDIALICEAYDTRLSEVPGAVCDMYEKLCTKLREEPFFENTCVFLDGFYGFTAREYEIISLISEQCDDVYVTFACDKGTVDAIYNRSAAASKKCEKIAQSTGQTLCDIELKENYRHEKNSSLYLIEKNFSTEALLSKQTDIKADNSVEIVVCKDIFDEAKFALNTVNRLVREGYKYSDIVICASNSSDYMGILDTAFEKAKIPFGADKPETLAESALFALVTTALECAKSFKNSSVIRYVKTGLSGLDEEQEDLFEMYIRTWDVSPSLMRDENDWTMNPDGYVDSEPDENVLRIVNSAKNIVQTCLLSLCENLKGCQNVRDYALAVYNLLEDIKRASGRDILDDGNDGISLELLYKCLDSFVAVAGDEKITLAVFVNLLKSCGKNYDTGHIPAFSNQVQFSPLGLARCDGTKFVILLGVNSGVIPSSCKSTALISDDEKNILKSMGMKLSDSANELVYDELFLAKSILCSATKIAFVSYVAYDKSGAALFPSVIISMLRRLTGVVPSNFNALDFENSFFGNEQLFEELTQLPDGQEKRVLEEYFSQLPEYYERLKMIKDGFNQNEYLSKATADELYDKSIVTSYSRLEKMAGCPFSHFCTYVLRLKPEPVANLGPSEAGSVMHKILEELVPYLCTKKEDDTYPDENEARQRVCELLERHLCRISRADITRLSKRFVYLYNRLSRILFRLSDKIVKELRVTKFVPCDFELTISQSGSVKPMPIDLSCGRRLYIVGQIDRVDVYEKDGVSYVRIVDYKTGKKTFKLKDIQNGFNLQMLLYLCAIKNGGKEKYGENIVPAGVLYSNVVLPSLTATIGKDDLETVAKSANKIQASGLFIDDEEILYAMDPTENSLYLPIGRKGTEITKKDAVASLEEMGNLLSLASDLAKALAEDMVEGKKSISPFDGKAHGIDVDPCKYCDMFPVCMGHMALNEDEE